MYAATDNTANDNTNTDQGDYSIGVTVKDMLVNGLTFGYSRIMTMKYLVVLARVMINFLHLMKVMPNMGVFLSLEDLSVVNTFIASTGTDGKISILMGIHYSKWV